MADIVQKHIKPGVLEWSGPELLLRMLEHEVGFERPRDKTVDQAIADIEEMARQAGPDSVAVVDKLKALTEVCGQYFYHVVEISATSMQ